jgi:hypothetical protein
MNDFASLTDPKRSKILGGFVGGEKTLTPSGLTSFRNTEKRTPRSPYPNLPLEEALNISYAPIEKTQRRLDPFGYKLDTALSTQQNKVFIQPQSKKLVFTTAGTNPFSPRDITTDAYLAFLGRAGLQSTSRYKESEAVLKAAREKYPTYKKTLTAHSLGSSIISNLAKSNEQVRGFGTGSGLFSQGQVGTGYRTAYDPFSYSSYDKTIPAYIPPKKGNLRGKQKVDYPQGIIPSHSYENLRSMPPIFV